MDIPYEQISRCIYHTPRRGSGGAAAWDLYASEEVILKPYSPTLVPVGLKAALPKGHALLILPRSSLAMRGLRVANSPGLIDEDYRGPIKVILEWSPSPWLLWGRKLVVESGERIGQALLINYVTQEWKHVVQLDSTTRGTKGFGSTGK